MTPNLRAAIQASDEPASVLAERFGTTLIAFREHPVKAALPKCADPQRWNQAGGADRDALAGC